MKKRMSAVLLLLTISLVMSCTAHADKGPEVKYKTMYLGEEQEISLGDAEGIIFNASIEGEGIEIEKTKKDNTRILTAKKETEDKKHVELIITEEVPKKKAAKGEVRRGVVRKQTVFLMHVKKPYVTHDDKPVKMISLKSGERKRVKLVCNGLGKVKWIPEKKDIVKIQRRGTSAVFLGYYQGETNVRVKYCGHIYMIKVRVVGNKRPKPTQSEE